MANVAAPVAGGGAPPAEEASYFDDKTADFINRKRQFTELLDTEEYADRITTMLTKGGRRLLVDLEDVRSFSDELAADLLRRPMLYVAPLHAALKTLALANGEHRGPQVAPDDEFSAGVLGVHGSHRVSPRQLMAGHVSHLVAVEGIVTKASMVRPKVVRSVHYCEATEATREASYHDATSLRGHPTGSIYPTKDENGNVFSTEFGLSKYLDHQTVAIQEMPERAPAGQLPCSVDVVLDADLVDSMKPGDRVRITGVYRTLPSKQGGASSGVFRAVLIANCVQQIGKDHIESTKITDRDVKEIRRIARRADVFELLSRSLAPSVHGHDYIKKAVTLLLLGGVEHNLENGTHIRGDINMLMVGDPSTAKSQFLRFVLSIAPLAINTTGRGSSGVGLTAAVVSDRDTGERRLEAGAMVLADRGVVCIDEFDKMSDSDRVAIHEVMEQQTVTIAKAGIHMSLNARCSVVAAANPYYGKYEKTKTPAENVALPDSLLSRFDLLFIVLDEVRPDLDRAIADHVLRNHRYQAQAGRDPFDDDDEEDDDKGDEDTPVFEKYDRMLHGHRTAAAREVLSIPFLKKYVQFAKSRFRPTLLPEAAARITEEYAQLRSNEGNDQRSLPVTARALETLIRVSSAHAKARLSHTVTVPDVEAALKVVRAAMDYLKIREEEANEDGGDEESGESSSSGDDDSDDSDDGSDGSDAESRVRRAAAAAAAAAASPPKRKRQQGGRKRKAGDDAAPVDPFAIDLDGDDQDDQDDDDDEPVKPPTPSKRRRASGGRSADPERLQTFVKVLSALRRKERTDELAFDTVLEAVNAKAGSRQYSREEALAILGELEKRNKVMLHDDVVHIV